MAAQQTEQPWVFDTRELIRRPGSMREVSRVVTPAEPIGTDVIAVPAGHPVELDLRMESVVEGVLATGTASAVASGVCVRCLDEVEESLDVHFQGCSPIPSVPPTTRRWVGALAARTPTPRRSSASSTATSWTCLLYTSPSPRD